MSRKLLGILLSGALAINCLAQQPTKPDAAKPVTEPAKPESKPEGKPEDQPEAKPAEQTPPEVTLMEAGAEPRKELRLTLRPDSVQNCLMRVKMDMTMKMGEMELPTPPMPAILMTMETKVGSVSPEGDITYTLRVADCRVEKGPDGDDQVTEMIEQSMEPMKRLTGAGTMSSRGINKDVKLNLPADMPATAMRTMRGMTDQMKQIGAPLPQEAVGLGAKWRVKTHVNSQGLRIEQTAIYTLKEVRDGAAILDVTMEQSAAEQKINAPGIPEGMEITLKSMKSTGSGTTEFPLTMMVPRKALMNVSTDLSMKLRQAGQDQDQDMTQQVKIEMMMTGKEGAAEAPKAKEASKEAPSDTPKPAK